MLFHALKNYWRRRRLFRNRIVPQCAVPTYTAGARSGVWTVCPEGLQPGQVVFSFGVGDNIAWELDLIERFGVTVHAFDPTPASVAWIARQSLPRQFHFHPIGLAAHDGTSLFRLPRHGSRFNFHPAPPGSSAGIEGTIQLPVRRLATIMRQLGQQRLAILKMDIEGSEYNVLEDLLAAPVPASQLLVEFHHHFPSIGVEATLIAVRALNSAGFRLFHISERGLELSFLNDSRDPPVSIPLQRQEMGSCQPPRPSAAFPDHELAVP